MPNEREWFETLFRAHYDAVLAYALRRTDPDRAKDAAAETFLVAWRRRRDIPDRALPWLLGVARNTLATQRRSSRRREGLTERLVLHRVSVETGDHAVSVAERAVVLAALEELAPRDREILELVAWDGLSPADASVVVGCSRATFAVRLSRARRRLEAALARQEHAVTDGLPLAARPVIQETR